MAATIGMKVISAQAATPTTAPHRSYLPISSRLKGAADYGRQHHDPQLDRMSTQTEVGPSTGNAGLDTIAINGAIEDANAAASSTAGTVVKLTAGQTYLVTGIIQRTGVTLDLNDSELKLADSTNASVVKTLDYDTLTGGDTTRLHRRQQGQPDRDRQTGPGDLRPTDRHRGRRHPQRQGHRLAIGVGDLLALPRAQRLRELRRQGLHPLLRR
jgi:hypothetical protein